MKKFLILIIALVILTTSMYGCADKSSVSSGQAYSASETAKLKSPDITKIIFYDQSVGMKPFVVEDKQKIDEFIGYLDNCKVEKKVTPRNEVGWMQQAAFYSNDNEITVITFGNPMIIDNTDYDVIKNNLSSDKIDSFLRTIDSSWKKS